MAPVSTRPSWVAEVVPPTTVTLEGRPISRPEIPAPVQVLLSVMLLLCGGAAVPVHSCRIVTPVEAIVLVPKTGTPTSRYVFWSKPIDIWR